jgi:predicted secreted protein
MQYKIIMLPAVLFAIACGQAANTNEQEKKGNDTIVNSNNQEEQQNTTSENAITAVKDSTFTIDLSAAVGTGYSWQLADSAFNNISFQGQTFTNDSTGKEGADGIQHFKFKAVQKGAAVIRFIYVRPFDKPFPKNAKAKSFSITIQ